MKKIIFLLILFSFSPLLSKENVKIPLYDLKGNTGNKHQLILLDLYLKNLYNMLIFEDGDTTCISTLEDKDDARLSSDWYAKIFSGTCDNSDYVILIYEPKNNDCIYKIEKKPGWKSSILNKYGNESGEGSTLTNIYFQIQNSRNSVVLTKKLDFVVKDLSLYDLIGNKLLSFNYDSYQYTFDTMTLPIGMYFIVLKTSETSQAIKIILN